MKPARCPARTRVARCLVLLAGCLSFASGAHAQSPETTRSFAWSYPDQWISQFGVVDFEIRINEGNAHSAGMSVLTTESQSYSTPIPSVDTGQHVVEVRACSSARCGAWSSPLYFLFFPPFVIGIQPQFGATLGDQP